MNIYYRLNTNNIKLYDFNRINRTSPIGLFVVCTTVNKTLSSEFDTNINAQQPRSLKCSRYRRCYKFPEILDILFNFVC